MRRAEELRAELDELRESLPDIVSLEQYDELHRRIGYLKNCLAPRTPAPKYKENRVKGEWIDQPIKRKM